jgi:predicted aspartyl protease
MEKATYMGKVWEDVELSNASDEFLLKSGKLPAEGVRKTQVHALVDSGATMLVLPLESITALGLQLTRTARSRFADGKIHERNIYGPVKVKVFKRTMQAEALEGAPGMPALLGQIPLEALDLLIDSKNQRLILNPESPDPEMALVDVF